jgi:hypothetical protein
MTPFGTDTRFMIMLVLLCGAVAIAGPEKRRKTLTLPQTTSPQTAASAERNDNSGAGATAVKRLPGTIKINPSDLGNKGPIETKSLSPAFYAAWDRVTKSHADLSKEIPRYEERRRVYRAKFEECSHRTYSQQDMTAAGCKPTDTVAECSQKLFRWCINPYEIDAAALFVHLGALSKSSKTVEDEFYKSVVKK